MAKIALGMYAVFLLSAFGGRTWLQYVRTRDHGLRMLWREWNSIEWLAVVLFAVGAMLAGLSPLAELSGFAGPERRAAAPWLGVIGVILTLLGFTLAIVAQLDMRESWRIGVGVQERTALVTAGLFAHVRNPIFSGVLLGCLGLVLMVPNLLSFVALASLLLGIELQVRRVEEPYLMRIHGSRYLSYARQVGRFVPGIGCMSP